MILLASDSTTGKQVVIKMADLPSQPDEARLARARIVRCASLRFRHPAIADPIDLIDEGTRLSILFEYIEGKTLAELVAENGPHSVETAQRLMHSVAQGLAVMHARGIVHRDLKPANVIVRPSGEPVILDLGIARDLHQPTISDVSAWVGSDPWLPPEQRLPGSAVSSRADVAALGAIAFFLLTGAQPPSSIEANAWPLSVTNVLSDAPTQLDQLIERMTGPEHLRPADGAAVVRELDAINSHHSLCLACGSPWSSLHMCRAVAATRLELCGFVRHVLQVMNGPQRSARFVAPAGKYTVGRNEICPSDLTLSRRHLVVECHNGSLTLSDAGAVNPVRLNALVLRSPTVLRVGDRVRVGSLECSYQQQKG